MQGDINTCTKGDPIDTNVSIFENFVYGRFTQLCEVLGRPKVTYNAAFWESWIGHL
jgi:urate oxidase